MRQSNAKLWIAAIAVTLAAGVVALVGSRTASGQADKASAASSDRADTTYTWSAELVDFDAASNRITVRAMLVSNPEQTDLAALHAGDRAVLTWSGLSMAAGVRAVQRGSSSSFDRMTMPIEYVASELDGRYVSFKVPIPARDAAAIAKLTPGTHVTATSPLQAKSMEEAVTTIRPYNDPS
jgi:hypothetical protein